MHVCNTRWVWEFLLNFHLRIEITNSQSIFTCSIACSENCSFLLLYIPPIHTNFGIWKTAGGGPERDAGVYSGNTPAATVTSSSAVCRRLLSFCQRPAAVAAPSAAPVRAPRRRPSSTAAPWGSCQGSGQRVWPPRARQPAGTGRPAAGPWWPGTQHCPAGAAAPTPAASAPPRGGCAPATAAPSGSRTAPRRSSTRRSLPSSALSRCSLAPRTRAFPPPEPSQPVSSELQMRAHNARRKIMSTHRGGDVCFPFGWTLPCQAKIRQFWLEFGV